MDKIKNLIKTGKIKEEEYDMTVREFLNAHPELDVDDADLFEEGHD